MKYLILILSLTSFIAMASTSKNTQQNDSLKNAIAKINAGDKLITKESKETIGENKGNDLATVDQQNLNINDSTKNKTSL